MTAIIRDTEGLEYIELDGIFYGFREPNPPPDSPKFITVDDVLVLPKQTVKCPPSLPSNYFHPTSGLTTDEFFQADWQNVPDKTPNYYMRHLVMCVSSQEPEKIVKMPTGAKGTVKSFILTNKSKTSIQLTAWNQWCEGISLINGRVIMTILYLYALPNKN
jgi:hypothetical protein